MELGEYQTTTRQVLDSCTFEAVKRLVLVLQNLPSSVRSVAIEIFPWQSREGGFSIRANLEGPDLHVLNRAIKPWAVLFDVRHTSRGLDPPVPMLDPFDESFDADHAIVDCAVEWIKAVWEEAKKSSPLIPVSIVGHGGAGTTTPFTLQR